MNHLPMPNVPINAEHVRQEMLALLRELHNLCSANNLTYYLAYGSLLGLVRHRGMIPWDDDVDVWMPRSDAQALRRLLAASDKFDYLDGSRVQPWHLHCAKLSMLGTTCVSRRVGRMPYGIYIDVFPLDGHPSRPLILIDNMLRQIIERVIYSHLFSSCLTKRVRRRLERAIHGAREFVAQRTEFAGAKNATALSVFDSRFCIPSRYFGDPVPVEFDGIESFAPQRPDKILQILYGNYLELPPDTERVGHEEDFFRAEGP